MNRQPARQSFGLKNSRSTPAASPVKAAAGKGSGRDINIHPMILAGGTAFVIAIAAVMMMGGQPQVQPGQGPQITELPPATTPAAPAASGGKFGAATSAFQQGPAR